MKKYIMVFILLLSVTYLYGQSLSHKLEQRNSNNVQTESSGFPEFLGIGSVGYTSVGGNYYRGFNSGLVIRVGGKYFLPDTDPTEGRYMMGFSYSHSSIDGDLYFGLTPKLYLNAFSIDFGRTTSFINDRYYLYGMAGLAIISNSIDVPQNSVIATNSDAKLALNLEAGVTLLVTKNISALLNAGYFIVVGQNSATTNTASTNSTFSVAGGGISFSLGLGYSF